jgi:tRNA (guanosine-2'-O-)-methyltransferase
MKESPDERERQIAQLETYVSEAKRAKMASILARRTGHLRVILEDVYQPHNASAVMRSCDCFGVQHLHVTENHNTYRVNPDVAMGSQKWITLHRHRDPPGRATEACFAELRSAGFRIVATALRPESVPLAELDLTQPLALCFGTERDGLSEAALEAADAWVHLPMYGFTQSFNVSVCAALCLHDMRRRLDALPIGITLPPDEQRAIYLSWLKKSVHAADAILAELARRAPSN